MIDCSVYYLKNDLQTYEYKNIVRNQLLNKTPSQMIQERIILEAQRLLVHSELNVNQIGYRLGFDDPSYFLKYFKKHTKMSPSDFRKAIS
jgi:AraC-like DNA-binding protein